MNKIIKLTKEIRMDAKIWDVIYSHIYTHIYIHISKSTILKLQQCGWIVNAWSCVWI